MSSEVVDCSHLPIQSLIGHHLCDQLYKIKKLTKDTYAIGSYEDNTATPDQAKVLKFFLVEAFKEKLKVNTSSTFDFSSFQIYVYRMTRDGYKVCFHSEDPSKDSHRSSGHPE